MQFVNPLFLFALSALAIPIIIHLFNFRRYKKVYFTNVRFLTEIKQESKKRSELKHLLILLARLLAIACLVFAFAQPYLTSPTQQKKLAGRQAVSVYIDNSFSMEALATNGKLIEVAKTKAKEIAAAYKPSDLFQLLTTDFEGKHQRFVNRDEFTTLVDEVTVSSSYQPLSHVIQRQEELLKSVSGVNRSVYVISDFQRSSTNLTEVKQDTALSYYFIPLNSEKINNLYIDSVWFDSPFQQAGRSVTLKVKIKNCGDESLEKIPVKLTINSIQKAVASFSIDALGETTLAIPYTNELGVMHNGVIEITDYPVSWDDHFYFSYPVVQRTPILSINGDKPNIYLEALFENDSSISLQNISSKQIDYSSFRRFPLIILNSVDDISSGMSEELRKFLDRGGNLLIFPSGDIEKGSYNAFLSTLALPLFSTKDTTRLRVAELNTQAKVYQDVFEKDASGHVRLPENIDLPLAFKHYTQASSTKSGMESLMTLQNGQSLLGVAPVSKGVVYISTVPLDATWTNWMKHPIFVPTLYRIAILSQIEPALYYRIGSGEPIELREDTVPTSEVYTLRKQGSDFETIPETRSEGGVLLLFTHDQVKESGLYDVVRDQVVVQSVAFNYSRFESELACLTTDQLDQQAKQAGIAHYALFQGKKAPLTKAITSMSQGTPLWKLFIFLALLFFAIEIALVRLMKE